MSRLKLLERIRDIRKSQWDREKAEHAQKDLESQKRLASCIDTYEISFLIAELEVLREHDASDLAALKPRCVKPPKGWICTRELGHGGPCAAVQGPSDYTGIRGGDESSSALPRGGAGTEKRT